MDTLPLAMISSLVLAVGMFSRRLQSSMITPTLLFTLFGMATGPYGLDILHIDIYSHATRLLIELTLTILLFIDGCHVSLRDVTQNRSITGRLLIIGIPLSLFLGTITGAFILSGFGFWMAAILAAVLTPTDVALGHVAVSNERLPQWIRTDLMLESGLNDGLLLPVIMFLAICESVTAGRDHLSFWIYFAIQQVGLGVLSGALVGSIGAFLLLFGSRRHVMNEIFHQLFSFALAILAFSSAELVGGNGFISALVAGIAAASINREAILSAFEFGQAQSQLFSLLSFMIFGAILVPETLRHISWEIAFYALSNLIFVRVASALISLIGSKISWKEALFLAWMGPKGIASLLFGLLLIEQFNVPQGKEILSIVTLTVFFSIILHGITAAAFTRKLAK